MQPSNSKFASLPQDADTRIKSQRHINMAGIDALHQVWTWDGVKGESLIFAAADLSEATDRQIVDMAQSAGFVTNDPDFDIKRSESGFVFLNFGFE